MLESLTNSPLCKVTLGEPHPFSVPHFFRMEKHNDIPHLHVLSPRLGMYSYQALGHRKNLHIVSTLNFHQWCEPSVCRTIHLVFLFILLLLDYVLETLPCFLERGFSVGNLELIIISIRSREVVLLFCFSAKFKEIFCKFLCCLVLQCRLYQSKISPLTIKLVIQYKGSRNL